jgi:hypothetical protein
MAAEGLNLGRAWDDTFRGWTDELQLGRKYRKPTSAAGGSSSGWTGASVKSREPSDYADRGSKQDVRARLAGMARASQQVMVKITPGKNRTMRSVRDHLFYIARDGEEAVRDQDGNVFHGAEAVADLGWGWQHAGPRMPEEAQSRLAFNFMFSMPEGTDERALFEAVRATSCVEFAGNQWVMVQHFDEPQVHCHVCVKAEGMDGVRLNPRKADLQRIRERFAHELRERGVEAEATRRASRLHRQRLNKPWQVTRLEERGLPTNPLPGGEGGIKVKRWKDTELKAASSFGRIIEALQRSDDVADRVLARELSQSLVGAKAQSLSQRGADPKHDLERI